MVSKGKSGPSPQKAPIPQGGYPGTGNPAASNFQHQKSDFKGGTPGLKTFPKRSSGQAPTPKN